MLNPLADELNSGFYSACSVRKLSTPLTETEHKAVLANYEGWKGTKYAKTGRVVNAALDCEEVCPCCEVCCMNTESKKQHSAFCSELVTHMV